MEVAFLSLKQAAWALKGLRTGGQPESGSTGAPAGVRLYRPAEVDKRLRWVGGQSFERVWSRDLVSQRVEFDRN